MSGRSISITKPYVILCEGKDDCALLDALIREHSLPSHFQVLLNEPTGITGFGGTIEGIEPTHGYSEVAKALLLIADSDDADSFNKVAEQVAACGWEKPSAPEVVVRAEGKKDLVILMLPRNGLGSIESIALPAFHDQFPTLKEPINNVIAHAQMTDWSQGKRDKMQVHVHIASTCRQNPGTKFHEWVLDRCEVNLRHGAFDEIVGFLQEFPNLLTA